MGASSELLLWDDPGEPPVGNWDTYRWNGYSEQGDVRSLLRYCESHAEGLRTKYLAWIDDIGEIRIGKKSVIEHLVLEDGLSYWWMTLLVEKSPYKSPLTDAIRLLAVEEILEKRTPASVHLVSQNRQVARAIQVLCEHLGVACRWTVPPAVGRHSRSAQAVVRDLPGFIQAVLSIGRYLWTHKVTRKSQKRNWSRQDRSLSFVSYLFNFSPESAKSGVFQSRYWGGLHRLIREMAIPVNWLHLYVPHEATPNAKSAHAFVKLFNLNPFEGGTHALLESYLTWPMVANVVKRWVGLYVSLLRLRKIGHAFNPTRPHFFLWFLMRNDWKKSMVGTFSINNLLSIALFDAALKDMPPQKKGFYLCENQSWERGLIHAWQKHGHGQLIAVPHSTVRFWDLRYFSGPRAFQSAKPYSMPRPHLTALNGKAAVQAYIKAGYPPDALMECEALRFEYLYGQQARRTSTKPAGAEMRLLVLGEYSAVGTGKLLQLLEATVAQIPTMVITIKPHPGNIVIAADYPLLSLSVNTEPLEKVLNDYDVVYSGNMTSAAVDVYLAGLPLVVMLDESELNFSPLRGKSDVHFVSTPGELASELLAASHQKARPGAQDEFFFLDPEYPRWKQLLELPSQATAE
jgi:surface carbohydrate biosynthesis protein (TIGR04326 family)